MNAAEPSLKNVFEGHSHLGRDGSDNVADSIGQISMKQLAVCRRRRVDPESMSRARACFDVRT